MRLVDPAGALHRELTARGVEVSRPAAAEALQHEMRFYKAQCLKASDEVKLAALRDECATILRVALAPAAQELPHDELLAALLAAIRFEAYPDVRPALERWRAAGIKLGVVSNWDVSLHAALEATGLAPLVDVALSSAEVGKAKPDPALLHEALSRLGVDAGDAVLVGDTPDADVEAAKAAGVGAVLVLRDEHASEGPPDPLLAEDSAVDLAPMGLLGAVPVVATFADLWP